MSSGICCGSNFGFDVIWSAMMNGFNFRFELESFALSCCALECVVMPSFALIT